MMNIPEDLLASIEFLPNGDATNDGRVWLSAWIEYARYKIITGKIRLEDIDGINDEGTVPFEFIKNLYLKDRLMH